MNPTPGAVCALIPAAGFARRLGGDGPKILTPITATATIWSLLRDRLLPLVDHIHVVLSPAGRLAFPTDTAGGRISTSVQLNPIGMGDAIFGAASVWSCYPAVLVIWGDQVQVSAATLAAALAAHAGAARRLVVPLARLREPYVEYRFDANDRLTAILQSREGDPCAPGGRGDVGTFVISTLSLAAAWKKFRRQAAPGAATGEINFLPFLTFLVAQGWELQHPEVANADEARGINTPADLRRFRQLYDSGPGR